MIQHKTSAIFALIAVILLLWWDFFLFQIPFLQDAKPYFSPIYLGRSIIILAISMAIIWAFSPPQKKIEKNKDNINLNTLWKSWGLLHINIRIYSFSCYTSKLLVFILSLNCCFFLLLFLHSPYAYSLLSYEDGAIENASAIFFGLSALIYIYISFLGILSYIKLANMGLRHTDFNPYLISGSIGLAAIFTLIALEEISWFQRILELPLIALFKSNAQQELNIHNFATNEIELAFYFASFVFLVLLPFYFSLHPKWTATLPFKSLIPSPWLIICGSFFIPLNYDMWNNLLIQLSFFSTLCILSSYWWYQYQHRQDTELIAIVTILCIAQQLLFLLYGYEFRREWEVTEYKELFIALAFFIYSLDSYTKIKKRLKINCFDNAIS